MSITVRQFSDKELEDIQLGRNDFLATVLLNKATYTMTQLQTIGKIKHNEYVLNWYNQKGSESVRATDDQTLFDFIKKEYKIMPDEIFHVTKTYRNVPILI